MPFRYPIGPRAKLLLIAGPCVIESEEHAFNCALTLKKRLAPYPVSFVFKASYDKANRTHLRSYRGPGLERGLAILQRIQKELDLPVITDVHSPSEATLVGSTLEAIQIPAFLSRQTDLLIAAAKTPALVSVKKGQFLSPWDMSHVVDKLRAFKEQDILLTDRGTTFGYNQLITDIRAIPIMQSFKVPVCFDASHSIQKPGGLGSKSGGDSEFIPILSRAAIAAGADALYIECHPKPQEAMSDGAS